MPVGRSWVGDARRKYPVPLRLRNQNIEKEMGGSAGYRGSEFYKKRQRVLYRGRNRSSTTGKDQTQDTLQIDHIIPYRCGGLSTNTNSIHNLRVVNQSDNPFTDYMESGREKPPRRKLKGF